VPFEEIAQTLLFEEKKSKDPQSTKQELKISGNYMNDLDRVLQGALDMIIKTQKDAVELNGGNEKILVTVKFQELESELVLRKVLGIGELKEYKFGFLKINRNNPISDLKKAGIAFIYFIESNI
jgi:hypothetical protein